RPYGPGRAASGGAVAEPEQGFLDGRIQGVLGEGQPIPGAGLGDLAQAFASLAELGEEGLVRSDAEDGRFLEQEGQVAPLGGLLCSRTGPLPISQLLEYDG